MVAMFTSLFTNTLLHLRMACLIAELKLMLELGSFAK